MQWATVHAHFNINMYKSRPTGAESSAADTHTHTGMQKCVATHTFRQTSACLLLYTYTQKQVKRPIMDVTARHLWLDRFPRSVWNICQPETYTKCRLFTPVGGKHTLCKWFFFWNETHTTRNGVLMVIMSAKANGCCVCACSCAHCIACVIVCYTCVESQVTLF